MRLIYFYNFHSVPPDGVIFWGNSVHSKYIFRIKKRTIRVITDSGIGESCEELFKQLQIMSLYYQYIYSLLIFVVKNRDIFKLNSDIYSTGTR
jgi:hypothetical protein